VWLGAALARVFGLVTGRNGQLLTNLELIRILKLVAVSVVDPHVLVWITVKLLADLGQVVTRLHRVGLTSPLEIEWGIQPRQWLAFKTPIAPHLNKSALTLRRGVRT
jgi:hypothetical protein